MLREIPKSVTLIILDGWGIAPAGPGNPIEMAQKPNFNRYWNLYPHTILHAAGEAVGLPKGEDGNSEVGHQNIGAGKVIYQDLLRINMAIAQGSFITNPAFVRAVEHVNRHNSNLHLFGLIGSGVVHSSIEHLYALLWLAKEYDVQNVFLHAFTDGRDSPPNQAASLISEVENRMQTLGVGKIATVSGRYYAMDRDNRWEREGLVYNCLTLGEGEKASSAQQAILNSYKNGVTDEFVKPTSIVDADGRPVGLVSDNDGVIFFNFRVDRAKQLTKAFVLPEFEEVEVREYIYDERFPIAKRKESIRVKTFDRKRFIANLFFVTMTEYERALPIAEVAFPPQIVPLPLGLVIAERGKRQLHVSESEKERFVTYYFNGMREDPFSGEDRIIIPSSKVPTYDLKPEMSAFSITDVLIPRIKDLSYDFIVVNFANPDMVSHTGKIPATIKAIEVIDECLKRVVNAVLGIKGTAIITADHGNAEELFNAQTGDMDTEHSANPVPFIAVGEDLTGVSQLQMGILADIAPTILAMMNIPHPLNMTGRDLLA